MNIEFNAERHEYRVNGVIVPSVTQVLQSVGLPDLSGVPADLLEWKAGLGTAVHRATELDDLGDLDEESLDPAIKPYLEAYRKFKEESGFCPLVAEGKLYHPKYQYAGTFDRICGISNGDLVLVDLKTGIADPKIVGPQLAAYVEAWHAQPNKGYIKRRYALKLNKDATYRLIKLDNKMDFQIFLNALNIYKWRNQ
jgi:hypothetical protein